MAPEGIISEILDRETRQAADDARQQNLHLRLDRSHRPERDYHDFPEEGEEQYETDEPGLDQNDQIMGGNSP